MNTASTQILLVLEFLVKPLPIGTNLALLQLVWAILNGSFLSSRGAVHTALANIGLDQQGIKRSWRALRSGIWSIDELLIRWHLWVATETTWQPNHYAGWQPVAIDITTFWRPKLQKWCLRGFHRVAGRLMPGVAVGVIVKVGQIQQQRLPLLHKLYRAPSDATDEEPIQVRLLAWANQHLDKQAVAILDGGFKLKAIQQAAVPRFVVRMATNAVFRRNLLPQKKGVRGPNPQYGNHVRPLARTYQGNHIAETPPDKTVTFSHQGVRVEAHGWQELLRADQKVAAQQATLTVWAFHDPRYKTALVIATNLAVDADIAFKLYLDRWPVEQVPLAAKQMLGLQRMFVHARASVWRLPELALLMGNILTIVAAILPAQPTGFWDRNPKKQVVACEGYSIGLISLN